MRSLEIAGLALALAIAPRCAAAADDLRKNFADPPAQYRSMPLWVWNDEMAWPRLAEQLAQFRRQGMGGVFVHPRPGLMTEYLGRDWFSLWRKSIAEGKRLGMEVNIYDENSYPAGFSGGYVPARAPDTAAQYVTFDFAPRVPGPNGERLAVFAARRDGSGAVVSATRLGPEALLPEGSAALVFRLDRVSGRPWTAGFPYVDLTNPEAARLFLETTYEPYKREIGAEFGKTVRWSFNDEPQLAPRGATWLPLSRYTLAEFRKRNGYDLLDELPALYWNTGDYRKVRFDYWQTLHDLWKENYFQPIYQWCAKNGIGFTGHWMEHEWPYPFISPDDASFYAFEHMPGIDLLEGNDLRREGADPHMLFTAKQVSSVAHQLGRRAFVEAYGVAGWDSTLEHYKRVGDWLLVHGLNFIDQHLAFSTVRGARKRDHPQSFTDVSAWWPYYRLHGDHLARVSYVLSQGQSRNRVAVLEPTTSAFLDARPAGDTPALADMRKHYSSLMQDLADHWIDFDLADEYLLEWHGKAAGAKLAVGKASYEIVVWPADMTNVRSQTVPLLEAYLAGGGRILALGEPAAYVDGRPADRVRRLRERYAGQWTAVPDHAALIAGLRRALPPRMRFDRELPGGIGVLERSFNGGERALFLANTGSATVRARATVEAGALEIWDTVTGRIAPARFERSGPDLSFDVELAPAGSLLLLAKRGGESAPADREIAWSPLQTTWTASLDSVNTLPLDYCDLKVSGVEYRGVNTWRANWLAWQAHGFERPAWDNAVQFERRTHDRNRFGEGTGFEAGFHFEVADEAALAGLRLAIELPELYRVEVNGKPLPFANGERWLDPHIRSAGIEKLAHPGENTVTITGRPFDVRMELENIFLLGRFRVVPSGKGFRIAAPGGVAIGSWAKQGYPFFAGAVTYKTTVESPAAGKLRVALGDWSGSVVAILLDGKQVAVLGWQPWVAEIPAGAGRHELAVRVVSTPRNLLGPFHNPSKPRMRAWPAAWAEFPETQPPGERYDVLDYGLVEEPRVMAGR